MVFRRRDSPPVDTSREDFLPGIADDVEEGIICARVVSSGIPEHDSDDVGFDETTDLSVALFDIALELDVLLGRFSPPFRFEARERQRHTCEDGDNDDGG